MEAGEACWWDKPVFLWLNCTHTPASLKAQLWGSRYRLHPPACSALCRNANIQLSEEKYNLGRNTEKQQWIPVRAAGLFCWLVHPRGLRSPRSSKMRTFRNYLWYHRCYQQALGNCRTHTQKNYFKLLQHGRMCGPKGGFAELTCMKWQDRQREQITIAALCSPPAFPN